MLSEKFKNDLLLVTKNFLCEKEPERFKSQKDVEDAIELLDKVFMIQDPEITFNESFAKIFEAMFLSTNPSETTIEVFNVEGFFKKLLRIVDTRKWDIGPSGKKKEWTLWKLYEAFGIDQKYPENVRNENLNASGFFSLAECKPEAFLGLPHLAEDYYWAYKTRNEKGHAEEEDYFNPYELMRRRQGVSVVFLDMCAQYKHQIERRYDLMEVEKTFDKKGYLKRCEEAYEQYATQYVKICWNLVNGIALGVKKQIAQIIRTDTSTVKLTGIAGTGKSESMKYAQYLQAKNMLNHPEEEGNRLPIYIPLIKMKGNVTLQSLLADTLHVEEEVVEKILKVYPVTLYLDGYNEILNMEVRAETAAVIDHMIETYKNMQLVIADRSIETNPPVAHKAVCYQLEPLRKTDILMFFERKTRNSEGEVDMDTLKLLKDSYDEKLCWLEGGRTTPLMLLTIIEIAQDRDCELPDSETAYFMNYIEHKYFREKFLKKDTRIQELDACLVDLVNIMPYEDSQASEYAVVKSFQNSGVIDLEKAQRLVFELAIGLGILESKEDTGKIGWAEPEYYAYYFEKGTE